MVDLFTPGTIGSMQLKNRLVRSATAECLASDEGRVTKRYQRLYARLAKGGVGLIVPGNYYVHAMGRALPRTPVLDHDDVSADLRPVTEAVQQHGARIVAQLNHGGRQCEPGVLGATPIAPSAVRDKLSRVKPRAMTEAEVEEAVVAYGEAARRARQAGFDGVQIHAAHGYLVNQFLSGRTNRRRDGWGGSLANRMRFLLEVYRAIRREVGDDYPVLVKINSEDGARRGVTLAECVTACQALEREGIDAIEVSGGIAENGLPTIRGELPRDVMLRGRSRLERTLFRLVEWRLRAACRFTEGYFLSQAEVVKQHVSVPVIAVGGMRRRATMERVLADGVADFVALSRPFIRQPKLAELLAAADDEDPITCSNCNRCALEVVLHHQRLTCFKHAAKS